jgi:hypothetical protein
VLPLQHLRLGFKTTRGLMASLHLAEMPKRKSERSHSTSTKMVAAWKRDNDDRDRNALRGD